MKYKRIEKSDAYFLTEIFNTPEYELYFAENETTEEDWIARMDFFADKESFIVYDNGNPIGWLMYEIKDFICKLDLIVLLESARHKGYGKVILQDLQDLMKKKTAIKSITLDVQKRNRAAIHFYEKIGFSIVGEELQPAGDGQEEYYNMRLSIV